MVKTSDLIAGQAAYTTEAGTKVMLRALCIEDIQKGIEQIQAELEKKGPLNTLLLKMVSSGKQPSTSDVVGFMFAGMPAALKLTDLFGAACGKDGKWLQKLPLFDLLNIIKEITELTRPAETFPLFFDLFQMWKAAFLAMREEPES